METPHEAHPAPQKSLDDAIGEYLMACEVEGKSPRTVQAYAETLRVFRRIVTAANLPTTMGGFVAADVYRFLKAIMDSPVSLGTRHRRFRETRAFFSWCVRMGYVPKHPFTGIPNVRVEQKVIQPFSEEEIQQLLDACDAATAFGCRNRAIILLFLDTGMRALELLRVAVDDVHWESRRIHIRHGKGRKQRVVPVRGRARGGAARLHHALPRGGAGLSLPGHARRPTTVGAVCADHAVRPAGPPGRRGPRPCPSLPAHLCHLGDREPCAGAGRAIPARPLDRGDGPSLFRHLRCRESGRRACRVQPGGAVSGEVERDRLTLCFPSRGPTAPAASAWLSYLGRQTARNNEPPQPDQRATLVLSRESGEPFVLR